MHLNTPPSLSHILQTNLPKDISHLILMFCQPQFSLIPWPIGSSGGNEERFSRDPLRLREAIVSRSQIRRDVYSLTVSIQYEVKGMQVGQGRVGQVLKKTVGQAQVNAHAIVDQKKRGHASAADV